jgi:signal peptidase II
MQAARGASLNDPSDGSGDRPTTGDAPSAGPAEVPIRAAGRLTILLAVAAGVLALDVASKLLAVAELSDREPIRLLGGLLTLRLVRNPGAAFGMAQGLTVVFTCVAAAVVVVILRFARRLQSAWWAAALGLVLGGALGNLVDRLLRSPGPGRGHVVDFLELPRWPVFNLADSAIVVAGLVMVGLSARGVPHGAERHQQEDEESPAPAAEERLEAAPNRDEPPGPPAAEKKQ